MDWFDVTTEDATDGLDAPTTSKYRSSYAVRFPSGTRREYDYAVVNTYKSVADMERSIEDVVPKIHPNIPVGELFRRTGAAREQVRGEMWYQIEHIG